MSETSEQHTSSEAEAPSLEQLANQEQPGLISEFTWFLMHNKKWWLTPIIVILLLVGLLILFGGSAVAPFIYPLI